MFCKSVSKLALEVNKLFIFKVFSIINKNFQNVFLISI